MLQTQRIEVICMTHEQENDIATTLAKARETYGNTIQILVAMEELNELACVLAKFPRYDSEYEAKLDLHQKVVDEVADVEIILHNVKAIFNLNQEEVDARKLAKTKRLQRWLDNSPSMQRTIEDRTVNMN